MERSVLIVAPADDVHARALAAVLESELATHAIVWDSASLPAQSTLDFILTEDRTRFTLEGAGGSVSLDEIRSIWWRRPGPYQIDYSVTDPKVRNFCLSECDALFKGALNSIDIPIVNDPFFEQRAAYKPFQLSMAKKAGLEIPRTIMSNRAEAIREFWESLDGRCIYKPFTAPYWTIAETRPLTAEDLADLGRLKHAPIIVQEKIDKGLDVRVNIFGDAVFAAAVSTHVPEAELDWRLDLTSKWREHALPDAIGSRLKSLLNSLGLRYGCFDLRQQPDGRYRFLEVNPSGQFLFVEIDTGQPLLRALGELLVDPDRGHRKELVGPADAS